MALSNDILVIGLTGAFGSGCSTSAKELNERGGFTIVQLSDVLRDLWNETNPGAVPSRRDLQKLGNEVRENKKDAGALARLAITKLDGDASPHNRLVIDGIRNIGEIEFLRSKFGYSFFLFGLSCPTSDRWERLKHRYKSNGQDVSEFAADDERDRDEEYVYGQQVNPCIDRADVLLDNSNEVTTADRQKKLSEYIDLITGAHVRYATPGEHYMNMCYSSAHGSKCLKRQVGAVLVDAKPHTRGAVVGVGYNENPAATEPCVDEPAYGADKQKGVSGKCYRDIVRSRSFAKLAADGRRCPSCGERLVELAKAPWSCRSCNIDLEQFFWPERAMSLCTAIHAEMAAILAAGKSAKGTTLYSTTFPCFQCAEKLIEAGIADVVFTESYPDIRAAERLEMAQVGQHRFEGVRSYRFHDIFGRARPAHGGD